MRADARERAHVRMMIELDRMERDIRDARLRGALIPADWRGLEKIAPVRPRGKKVTVALDEEVASWFRRLRTYMLALISKEVLSADARRA